jgi:hypothetical protein
MVKQVTKKKFYHVTVAAPYKTPLVAGQTIKVGGNHNPFFGFYENAIQYPVIDHLTGTTFQVKAVEWLKRVKAGTINPASPQVLAQIAQNVAMHYVILSRELIMEEIRAKSFPDAPSRHTCIYAGETMAEAQQWNGKLGGAGTICELTCTGTIHRADSCLLLSDSEPLSVTRDRANQYWSGEASPAPLMETLFIGDAKVTGFGL